MLNHSAHDTETTLGRKHSRKHQNKGNRQKFSKPPPLLHPTRTLISHTAITKYRLRHTLWKPLLPSLLVGLLQRVLAGDHPSAAAAPFLHAHSN